MPTITRKVFPPVSPEVRLVVAPIAPCELLADGSAGSVTIGGKPYTISYHGELPESGDVEIHGYRLEKEDGTTYDIPSDLSSCECLDHLSRTRKGGCRHIVCVRTLRNAGQII